MTDRLTGKQERFAQLVASGKTEADGYRAAYDTEGCNTETVWNEASKLARSPQVSARISELREQYAVAAGITQTAVLADVVGTSAEARTAKKFGPALKGLELLGKHVGLFQDRTEIEVRVKHELVGATYDDLRAMWEGLES